MRVYHVDAGLRRPLLGGYAKLLVPRPPVRRLAGPAAEVCGLAPRARLEDGTVAGLGGEAVAFASGAAPVLLVNLPVEEGLLMKCLIGIIPKSSIS